MNKVNNNDSDTRLRIDKSPKYTKFSSDDKILTTGLRSIAQEEIKQLFRKDIKTHLPTLQLHKSRDVSHLKDLNSPKSCSTLVNLPTDIRSLRYIIENKGQKNLEKKKFCKKKDCIERMVSLSPEYEHFEYNEQGVPTSRKEAENLLKWFRIMKAKHEFSNEFEIIAMISGQEVLKQVKGQCKHLGIILKNVLMYYKDTMDRAKKHFEQESELIRLSNEAKIKKVEMNCREEIEKYENKVKELLNIIEKNKNVIKNAQDDCKFYKTKLNEVQRLYLTEQDIWRKRSIELMKENAKNPITITHESYKLAVARWRKDLFYSEIEQQPTVDLPEVIRDKLENEQPLSPEELTIYRELYYKAEEIKNKKKFVDIESQTENLNDLLIEDQENFEDSLVKITQNIEKTEKLLEAVFDSKPGTEDKEIQADLDLELGVEDEILKELEKFLTVDENFEAILAMNNELGEESLNTSEESADEHIEKVEEKIGIDFREVEDKPVKKMKTLGTGTEESGVVKLRKKLSKQKSLNKTNTKFGSRTRSLTSIKLRNPGKSSPEGVSISRKNSKVTKKSAPKQELIKDSDLVPINPPNSIDKSSEIPVYPEFPKEKLLTQFSINSNKPETDLSQLSQDPQKLSNSLLKRRQTELIQNLISGKLGPTLKKSAQNLTHSIQNKIKDLESLNSQVLQKRNLLISLTTHINHLSPSSPKSLHKRVNSVPLENESTSLTLLPNLNDSTNTINKPKSKELPDFEIIDEVNEDFENIQTPFGLDEDTWKTGFAVGFKEGEYVGFHKGKEFASEELYIEGYAQATRELVQEPGEELDLDEKRGPNEILANTNKVLKKSKMLEVKSQKELTKFFEFNFNNKKITPRKSGTLFNDSVSNLLKKLPEFLKRKSKLSRKMLNKMMAGFYDIAYSQLLTEGPKELLNLCHDEIGHKYGLKKVSDRKFLEFLSELIKNKEFKRCSMFIKLININQIFGGESYGRVTYILYLESYKYMINSKIGILTNYDESDDKLLLPVNRAVECIKEKLEGKVEKSSIISLISSIEHKSTPDPRRINTALVELEFLLESICDCYEHFQQKIKNSTKKIFSGFIQNDQVPNYVFHIVLRTIAGPKYSKIEEMGIKWDLSLDEISEFCIGLGVFAESDLSSLIKGSFIQGFESYEELVGILRLMEEKNGQWISFSCEEWRVLLENCKSQGHEDEVAVLLWIVYEAELRRICVEISG